MVTTEDHPLGRPANEALPNLFEFLAGYFHEDWYLDYKSPDKALAAAITESSSSDLEDVRRELNWLLEQRLYEAELERVFDELGANYWTYGDGLSPRIWLHQVRREVWKAGRGLA